MATGGFSTKNASIGAYGPYIQWVITVFMFLAGVNFILHYQALKGHLQGYRRSEEFRAFFVLTLVVSAAFALCPVGQRLVGGPGTRRGLSGGLHCHHDRILDGGL